MDERPIIVIIHKILCSLNIKVNSDKFILDIQFKPEIMEPEKIVDKAKASAPTNLNELKEAISGSVNPFFLRYIFRIRIKAT